jgi:hypothetical protein
LAVVVVVVVVDHEMALYVLTQMVAPHVLAVAVAVVVVVK